MRKQKGFSLIELLIVVTIILIIAAIAIPNLMRSKQAANQSSAAGTIRTLITAEETYKSTWGKQPTGDTYADGLAKLGPGAAVCTAPNPSAANACLIDFTLGCAAGVSGVACTKDAYQFAVTGIGAAPTFTDYVAFATPGGPTGGVADYCASSDGSVHTVASKSPPPSAI